MSEKHTPGPWKWDEPANWHGLSARVCNEKYEPIAQVQISGWPKRTARANARLIAAAPDLLTICQELDACADYWSEYDVPLGIVDRLKAAIQKATEPQA